MIKNVELENNGLVVPFYTSPKQFRREVRENAMDNGLRLKERFN